MVILLEGNMSACIKHGLYNKMGSVLGPPLKILTKFDKFDPNGGPYEGTLYHLLILAVA
jgi:hypothetical protein